MHFFNRLLASMNIAGTGIESQEHFLNLARVYKEKFISYLKSTSTHKYLNIGISLISTVADFVTGLERSSQMICLFPQV